MKIRQMTVDEKNIYNSFKVAVIGALIGYGKMYELLHKQLVRKGRARYANYSFTYNGKTVKPLIYYDIKSQYAEPYSHDGVALGLNQLFMGQDPYKQFQGDTADDGIYHDTCHIVLKKANTLPTYDTYGWHIEGYGEIPEVTKFGEDRIDHIVKYERWHIHYTKTIEDKDEDGNVTSTETAEYNSDSYREDENCQAEADLTEENSTQTHGDGTFTTITIKKEIISEGWYIDVYYTEVANKENETIRIGDTDTLERVNLSAPTTHEESGTDDNGLPTTKQIPDWKPVYQHFDFSAFIRDYGEIKKIIDLPDYMVSLYGDGRYSGNAVNLAFLLNNRDKPESKLVVFENGTAFIVTSSYKYEECTGSDNCTIKTQPAAYRFVPLVYMDTGDLTISHTEFIDNWDDWFELLVVEDDYWYSGLVKIAMIVVSMAITYFFAVAAGFSANVIAAATAFAGIGAVGSVTGNKFLEILGVLGGLAATIEGVGTKILVKEATTKKLSKEAITKIAMNTTFGEAAKAFFSTVGFSNMLAVGKAALSIYFTLDTPGKPEIDAQEDMTEDHMKLVAMDSSDDYINDVIDLDKDYDIDDYMKV